MDHPQILFKYFPDLPETQKQQFLSLGVLYREWNEKINVISRKDIDHLYERHVLHSLGIAKVMLEHRELKFSRGSSVVDAGTGGGFPGIPLAIFFPEVHFHLVDSVGKKIRVVKEVAASLKLKNVTAEQSRVEAVQQKFDFAVSRAVAPLKEMAGWLKPIIKSGSNNSGMFFLKGGELENEIDEVKKKIRVFDLSNWFEEEFFLAKKVLYLKTVA